MREQMTIRDWVKGLGLACAGNANVRDCQAKAAAYAPMLAREFKAEAFTVDSLTAVSRGCTFFPSFGELCGLLSAWWDENRPYVPTVLRLEGPKPDIPKPRDPPTEAEMQYVGGIVRAFVAERRHYQPSRDLTPEVKPLPLSPGRLLAEYEKLAKQGDKGAQQRVAMLRQQLANKPQEDTKHAAP